MKKNIPKIIFIILLISIYFIKDIIYLSISDTLLDNTIIKNYENNNIYYEIDIDNNIFLYEQTKLLYQDIYSFKNTITIYKGSSNNIQEGMSVINSDGLVGIIDKVYKTSSTVKLLTNDYTVVSSKTKDSYGILNYNDKNIVYTSVVGDLLIGDTIYTSGLSNIYGGIQIGTIKEQIKIDNKTAYIVETFVNFNKINELVIIKGLKWYIYY